MKIRELNKQKIISIIPARGGSKGIPGKNIKLLSGKPLITYTIEQGKKSKYIDKVIVSTDDETIAEISRKYGAEIIMRPHNLATDNAPSEPVLEHAVKYYEDEGYKPDIIVFLQATSPLRKKDDIDKAIETFIKQKADSLLSVCDKGIPFIWGKKKEDAYFASINYDFNKRPRRQELYQYRENGSIYITKRDILIKEHCRLGGKIAIYIMGEEESVEIDSLFDFILIENIIKSNKEKY